MSGKWMSVFSACFMTVIGMTEAAPLRILAVGDSLTEEYAYELTFSAPDSDKTNANVRNWPELLRIYRPTEASLGPYEPTAFSYSDLRNAGHEWNFGIPGMTIRNWIVLLATNNPLDPPSGEALGYGYYATRSALINQLPSAEVIVIVLGSNDLKQDYNDIFNSTEPASFYTLITARLGSIHDWIRQRRPTTPIVIATIPDVGATPVIAGTYSDPVRRASARAKIATLNQNIVNLAASKGATVARLDKLTDRVFDEVPFQLNGTVFTLAGAPENPPDRVFCKDSFHAATVAQALITNTILTACTTATGRAVTQFSNRDILTLLGFNPDAPYNTWAAAYPELGAQNADDDRDGVQNLVEYALGTSPKQFGTPFTFTTPTTLRFGTSATALRYASLTVTESTNLSTWSAVPAGRITIGGDGTWTVAPSGAAKTFYRLAASPRP
ncbi:SGNH/GDSL hydrolase family protein [Luteolibacter ambystomatis]|uniref:SGNH/GDSL hydrolase family protein n=1 Tax=Luteolibacter ambystomatis TaxID=2824561 RepID=A0A975J2D9_9BACT|nr:SGNH/GDSL hydrolase family protein [Luteolibacter ambystomatis]QUE52727.1 SGNH/GDSL hydrolase family protein [Luteolibacter ambystomatis]